MSTISDNNIAEAINLFLRDKKNEEFRVASNKVLKFLVRRRLLSRTSNILRKLDDLINIEKKRMVAKVFSREKLKENIKKEIIYFLKKRYSAEEIILLESLDEKLLGGVRIEVRDEIIDLTIKNKIKKLQEHLISAQVGQVRKI